MPGGYIFTSVGLSACMCARLCKNKVTDSFKTCTEGHKCHKEELIEFWEHSEYNNVDVHMINMLQSKVCLILFCNAINH